MFIRSKRAGGHTYLQLVASRWQEGRPRQHVLASLGRLDVLRDSGQLARLLASGQRFLSDHPATHERPRRALVIDEDPRTARQFAAALDGQGWELTTCAEPLAGLVAAGSLRPDLIALELYPPGLDGYAACRRLRAAPELAHCRLLGLLPAPPRLHAAPEERREDGASGPAIASDTDWLAASQERWRAQGGHLLLAKPLVPEALASALAGLLPAGAHPPDHPLAGSGS